MLTLTTPPTLEPVSLADAKLHLRVETTADDTLIASLIATARQQIERTLSLALIAQSWSIFADAWPTTTPIALPLSPLIALAAVRTFAPDDSPTTLPLADFQLDRASTPPRLVRRSGTSLPSPLRRLNAIEIAVTAGFGASPADVPLPIRQAILHLVAHLYEHRDGGDTDRPNLPATVSTLLAPWQRVRV